MVPPSDPLDPDRSWGEYRRLVLAELERIARDMENLADKIEKFRTDEIAQIKTDLALLKLQAWGVGVLGGILVNIAISVIPRLLR